MQAAPPGTTVTRPPFNHSAKTPPANTGILRRSALRGRRGAPAQQNLRKSSAPPPTEHRRSSQNNCRAAAAGQKKGSTGAVGFSFRPPQRHVQWGKHYSIGSQEDVEGKLVSQVLAARRHRKSEQWREEQRRCGVEPDTEDTDNGEDGDEDDSEESHDGSDDIAAPQCRARSSQDLDGFDIGEIEVLPRGRCRSQTLDAIFSDDEQAALGADHARRSSCCDGSSSDEPPEYRVRRARARSVPIFDWD